MQDDELGGRLENLLRFRKDPSARIIRRHAERVGIDEACFLSALFYQLRRPRLIGNAVFEIQCKISELWTQRQLRALKESKLGIAGTLLAWNPHAGEVGLADGCLRRWGAEIRFAIGRARDSRASQVDPLRRRRRSHKETGYDGGQSQKKSNLQSIHGCRLYRECLHGCYTLVLCRSSFVSFRWQLG